MPRGNAASAAVGLRSARSNHRAIEIVQRATDGDGLLDEREETALLGGLERQAAAAQDGDGQQEVNDLT